MPEEWRMIEDNPYYFISSYGKVMSLKSGTPTIMRGSIFRGEYRRVDLNLDGKKRHYPVHRLVALTFLGDRSDEGLVVCHNDGNGLNNHLSNLRWGTQSSNMFDKVKHGTHHLSSKDKCTRGHELSGLNLRKSKSEGMRECLACQRARTNIRDWGKRKGFSASDKEFQILSDIHYKYIINHKKGRVNAWQLFWSARGSN